MELKKQQLAVKGAELCVEFGERNALVGIPKTDLHIHLEPWQVGACAYYRRNNIYICLPLCASPAGHGARRNYNWPSNTIDREPFGVVCHELGHHVDYHLSSSKSRQDYSGDFGIGIRKKSGEAPISGYSPNDAEWFAEMFRAFLTNPDLLRILRPKTYELLVDKFTPVTKGTWVQALNRFEPCPDHVIRAAVNKVNNCRSYN